MNELKPCPFCGWPGAVDKDEDGLTQYWAICTAPCIGTEDSCPVKPATVIFETEAEAIAAWNTRTAQAENTSKGMLRSSLQELVDDLPEDRCADPNCGGECGVRRRADAAIAQADKEENDGSTT